MVGVSCTHSYESIRDERRKDVGTMLSGSARPVPVLEDSSEG
jgi:hypothetical protein